MPDRNPGQLPDKQAHMDCSFTPQNDWFVFDEHGLTLKRGLKTKTQAVAWIFAERRGSK